MEVEFSFPEKGYSTLFQSEQDTVWTVTGPRSLKSWLAEKDLAVIDVYDLPLNYGALHWYEAEQVPCLCGDDVLIAIDDDAKKSYLIVDCSCGDWYPYTPPEQAELEDRLEAIVLYGGPDE